MGIWKVGPDRGHTKGDAPDEKMKGDENTWDKKNAWGVMPWLVPWGSIRLSLKKKKKRAEARRSGSRL